MPFPIPVSVRAELAQPEHPWSITAGDGPLVATAIHAGHEVPRAAARVLQVSEETRLREEDPFTDLWLSIAPSRVAVQLSRFMVDLNRPRDRAVYIEPADAWNLTVWRELPSQKLFDLSLTLYDLFYEQVAMLLDELLMAHERIVVLDLHSYCHRRGGPDAPPDDPAANPEINVGTGSVDRALWGGEVDRFVAALREARGGAGALDVRENVKFRGGHFPTWINQSFGPRVCALAVEVKKTFMDEWTGKLDDERHAAIGEALGRAAARLLEEGGR